MAVMATTPETAVLALRVHGAAVVATVAPQALADSAGHLPLLVAVAVAVGLGTPMQPQRQAAAAVLVVPAS
jgi:hypothetical protein